jgi:pyruvate/2-oxoglutarate dehydrogenase complex dihydrolipoamide dehydrogenase (E3) component
MTPKCCLSFEFAHQIRQWITDHNAKSVCVVGAAWAGLETADALRHRGLDVMVLELAPQVMPLFDEEMTTPLKLAMQAAGVKVITGDALARVTPLPQPSDGTAGPGGLELCTSKGFTFPVDLVVLSIGTKVENGLAKAAGATLGVRGAVKVDEHLRTSVPYVWAVGDLVESTNLVTGSKMNLQLAVRQC